MTLTLAEPSAGANAVGGLGGGLGYAGIAGVAVGLDTYPTDLVGIGVGAAGAYPNWVAQTGNTPALRQGSHQVDVTVSGDLVTVSIDGTQVISASVAVPPTVLVGFTGGTGAFTDAHDVSGVTITTDKGVPPSILPEVPLPALLPVSMAGIIGIIGIIVRRSRRTRKAVQ
jgi:hypothetical protein